MKLLRIFLESRMLVTLCLGFASGLPLALSGSTLQAWFTDSGLSLKEIGYVGLAGLPYAFKFVWAPLMDRWTLPILGRRRGWILLCQLVLSLLFGSLLLFTPNTHPRTLFFIACFIAFMSASQDIVIDAYRTDLLSSQERAFGAAMATNGYRLGMLVSGGLALILGGAYGWKTAFSVMTFLMGLSTMATLLGSEPLPMAEGVPRRLKDCIVLPLVEFLNRPQAIWILLFVVFYKLGDAFAGAMSQVFLLREIRLSLTEVGSMAKILGFWSSVLGSTIGGLLVIKMGCFGALLAFGVLQALCNLAYMPLMWLGPNYWAAGMAVFSENFSGSMASVAFTGFIMNLCNARFSAFQFALLSACSAVGRVFMGPLAANIAEHWGWSSYFMASLMLSAPGLLLLLFLKKTIRLEDGKGEFYC